MATPGMLVKVMAETLGIPTPTVILFDRVLAENGLRSKSGRGNSAAQVTERDAANLLIALMAAPVQGAAVRDAAVICQTYGQLTIRDLASQAKEFAKYGLHSIKKFTGEVHFSQAVSALIREAADGGEFRYRGRVKSSWDNDRPFNITVQGPSPWVRFQVQRPADEPSGPALFFVDRLAARKPPYERPDMWQARHVTYRTIRALGVLIAGDSEKAKSKKEGA
jgi:hypothetical protein